MSEAKAKRGNKKSSNDDGEGKNKKDKRLDREHEKRIWGWIKALGWKKHHDKQFVKEFMTQYFIPSERRDLQQFVHYKIDDLYNRSDLYMDLLDDDDEGLFTLLAEVVGRGKKFYDSVTAEELKKLADDNNFNRDLNFEDAVRVITSKQ
jgi:hypothetical protein